MSDSEEGHAVLLLGLVFPVLSVSLISLVFHISLVSLSFPVSPIFLALPVLLTSSLAFPVFPVRHVGIGCDRSDQSGEDISGLLTSVKVLLGSPVGFLFGDISLDLGSVEEPVLADNLCELDWLLEDGSPGLDGGDVGVHALAARDGFWEDPEDVADRLKTSDDLSALDVFESSLDVLDQRLDVGHAGAQLFEVVVSGEAVDKAGGEVGNEVQGREHNPVLGDLNGSDGEGHEISEVSACVEVELGVPVSLKSGDVGLDLVLVEQVVLGDGGGELGGVGEDGSPGSDGGDFLVHALAGAKSLRDLEGGEAKLECSLGVVVPASLLDVGDASLDLLSHELTTLVAGFDLNEFVVTGHTEHESGNEIGAGNDDVVLN